MVAVAVPYLPPPQHSPILGHFASSHTVFNFKERSWSLSLLKLDPKNIYISKTLFQRIYPIY